MKTMSYREYMALSSDFRSRILSGLKGIAHTTAGKRLLWGTPRAEKGRGLAANAEADGRAHAYTASSIARIMLLNFERYELRERSALRSTRRVWERG